MSRRPRVRALVAAVGAALALGALPAPAQAETEADGCIRPVVYCACIAAAKALSPVIPPESWDCNP